MIPLAEEIEWERGLLHLLNSGLAARLEDDGHRVTCGGVRGVLLAKTPLSGARLERRRYPPPDGSGEESGDRAVA